VHGVPEIRQNLLRAAAAALVFIRVAGLASNQFAVFERHASSANPVFPVADVDMVELCHASILCGYRLLRVAARLPLLLKY
jgi:hypothetical protein